MSAEIGPKAGDNGPRWLVIVGGIAALLASVATIVGVLITTHVIPNPLGGGGTTNANPFVGAWESTDVADGSHQTMTIAADGTQVSVGYHDDKASVCGGRQFQGSGTGSISGTQFTVVLKGNCLQPLQPTGDATLTFTYNASRDTLSDNFGNVWNRQG